MNEAPNGNALSAKERKQQKERHRRACRDLARSLDVSYRVWWRWTDTGRAWWLELTWDNRTGQLIGGGLYGHARVTGRLPDSFGWSARAMEPGPGRNGRLTWGGSSADYVRVGPGASRALIALDADTDVHTTANGTFIVTRADATVSPAKRGSATCTMIVPERS